MALAQIIAEVYALFVGWSGRSLSETTGDSFILAVCFVIQQVQVVLILFQRQ